MVSCTMPYVAYSGLYMLFTVTTNITFYIRIEYYYKEDSIWKHGIKD